jgi:Na+/melibiose symporter-like transporter
MLMHLRAEKIQKKKDAIWMAVSGISSVLILVFLIGFVSLTDGSLHAVGEAGFSGNSMLADSAGGYVLVGVIAFIVAVVFTLACLKIKDKDRQHNGLNDRLNAISEMEKSEMTEESTLAETNQRSL